jgi:hypothetical protein
MRVSGAYVSGRSNATGLGFVPGEQRIVPYGTVTHRTGARLVALADA